MLKFNKPLASASASPIINKSLSLTKANRAWSFKENDKLLKVRTEYEPGSTYFGSENDKNSRRHYLNFRYDSLGLLRNFLKASLDLDFQSVLNSFLVSYLMSGARRITNHEVGRDGIRSGLLVSSADAYNNVPINTSFDEYADAFINYYNAEDSLLGTITVTQLSHVIDHAPVFSHGGYSGSNAKKSMDKAFHALNRVAQNFKDFFASLDSNTSTSVNRASEGLEIRILKIEGTGNTVSYGSAGHNQQIPQSEPIRNKDGLYALIKVPRILEMQRARLHRSNAWRGESWNPSFDDIDAVVSPFLNPYSDETDYGESFMALSGCIIIKLGAFLNKSPLSYSQSLASTLDLGEDPRGVEGRDLIRVHHDDRDQYSTIGPVVHAVYPERVYKQVVEAQKRTTSNSTGLSQLDSSPMGSSDNQELLDLTYNPSVDPSSPVGAGINLDQTHFFGSQIVTEIQEHLYNNSGHRGWREDGGPESVRPGGDLVSESRNPYYGWFAVSNEETFSPAINSNHQDGVNDNKERDYKNSTYRWIDYGSPNKTHSDIVSMKGVIKGNVPLGDCKSKFNHIPMRPVINQDASPDTFVFFTQQNLCQDTFHLEGSKSVLSDYEVTNNPELRGRGLIFVDHDNVAYCPLSGDALYVMTYLKIGALAGHYGYWNCNVHNTAICVS